MMEVAVVLTGILTTSKAPVKLPVLAYRHSKFFYRPDALPVAQLCQSTEGNSIHSPAQPEKNYKCINYKKSIICDKMALLTVKKCRNKKNWTWHSNAV